MRIGIIGAGEIGSTLTRQYTSAGHQVKVANATGIEKLRSLATETGAKPVLLADVVRDVHVIIISIPFFAVSTLKDLFSRVSSDVTIVDTCNYYPIVSGVIPEVVDGMQESVWVSTQIARRVIKAYNTIFYRSLVHSGLPKGNPARLALPLAGDDAQAKELVATLINDSGFDSYDSGSLQDSWRQQPGSPAYCTDLTLDELKRSINKARRDLLPERRELGLKYILEFGPERWTDLVQLNRKIYESQCDPAKNIY
ncbi:MAG TPA: NAD(P)-binding domain-containing protein [Chryseosolibacter sp.]